MKLDESIMNLCVYDKVYKIYFVLAKFCLGVRTLFAIVLGEKIVNLRKTKRRIGYFFKSN